MLSLVVFNLLSLVLSQNGKTRFQSQNGNLDVTLELDTMVYTDPSSGLSFVSRVFNQQIPAPTLNVFPGDTLVITLKNSLQKTAQTTKRSSALRGKVREDDVTVNCSTSTCMTTAETGLPYKVRGTQKNVHHLCSITLL
jgi:FtsP/CotA-like multicopper oxidase with cupredoxin domain